MNRDSFQFSLKLKNSKTDFAERADPQYQQHEEDLSGPTYDLENEDDIWN